MAYFQTHILDASDRQWGEREVVQELMRHASSHFTLQTYSQAHIRTKRAAQRRIVEELLAEDQQDSILIPIASKGLED